MRPVHLVSLAVLLLSGFVVAQSQDGAHISDRVEVFGGYSFVTPDFSLVNENGGANGWDSAVNFKVRPWIGAVADFSGLYPRYTAPEVNGESNVSVSGNSYLFLFGPQVSFPAGRFSPFAHFLIGEAHVSGETVGSFGSSQNFQSDNALAFATGGGVDYGLGPRIAIRGQMDWLHTGFTIPGAQGTNFTKNRSSARISTGVVFRF